ncbi:MAG: glycosyltransferase family 39 protein [Verrucomicrobiota bacterium]
MVKRFRDWTWQWEAAFFGFISAGGAAYAFFGKKPHETEMASRHDAGKPAFLSDYMESGFWWAAVIVGWLAFLLAVTAPIWARASKVPLRPLTERSKAGSPRFFLILLVILIAALVPRAMRLDHSFWGDEAWWYIDVVGGRYVVEEDQSLSFRRHTWTISTFYDKSLNNHYLYTLAARVFDDSWRALAGEDEHVFSEAVVRLPALLAGILGIATGAMLLRRMGFGTAGLVFAALLAFHPWHIRYSSEARGYTFLFLFLTLVLWFLLEALESGRWRWWLAFAAAQFAALYSWKGAIHPLAAANVVTLVLLLKLRGFRGEGILQVGRWGAANVLSLMAFIPLFMPAVFQIQRKLETSVQERGVMPVEWFINLSSRIMRGTDWFPHVRDSPFDYMSDFLKATGGFGWIAIVLIAQITLFAFWQSFRHHGKAALLLLTPIVGAVLAYAHFSLNGNYLQLWYVVYAILPLTAFLAIGVAELLKMKEMLGVGIAGFLAFGVLVANPVANLVRYPVQDPRGASQVTRYVGESPWHLGPSETVTVGLYRRCVLYDPRIRQTLLIDGKKHRLRTAELLKQVIRECDEDGKPLRISMSNLDFAEAYNRDFVELVRDPRYFHPLRRFPAIDDYIVIETYEYKPGSLKD